MAKAIPRAIDYFPLLAADILSRLYTQFPTPIDWDANNLNLQAVDPDEDLDRLVEIWANTVRWLRGQGYITFHGEGSRNNDPSFSAVVLTEKGLKQLSTRSSLSIGKNIGDELGSGLTT